LTFLKNLRISIPFRNNQPDIKKQKEIANYLDNIYEKIKILKEKIQKQIAQLEKMKESILDEVFIVSSKIIYTKIDNKNTWEESESTKL